MSIVAFVTDAFAIRRILDHLALRTPHAEKPPPLREVLRVAEHGEDCLRAVKPFLGTSSLRRRAGGQGRKYAQSEAC
jgi:hypothetical protein